MSWQSLGKRAVREFGEYATERYDRPVHRFANKAADWFQRVTGFGDYQVSGNTLMTDNAPPMFQASGMGVRICHREYLGEINGSTELVNSVYSINPGLAETFPWLSQMTYNFEQYKMHGLIFEFRSTSADALNSTNTALGTVMMATDYDVYDAAFSTKSEFAQNMFTCTGPPSKTMMHPIECDPQTLPTKLFYIRHGNEGDDGRDLRFSDIGNFQLATIGMQAAANIGELWVTYDVELIKPQQTAREAFSDHFTAVSAAGTAVAASAPLGTGHTISDGSVSGFLVDGTSINWPPGYAGALWYVEVKWTGTSTASLTAPIVSLTGLTVTSAATGSGLAGLQVPALAVTNTRMSESFLLQQSSNPNTACSMSFGLAGTIPTTGSVRIIIFRVGSQ